MSRLIAVIVTGALTLALAGGAAAVTYGAPTA